MLLEIVCNGETTPVDLADGTVKLGGGPHDDIVIAGLPHALLTLDIELERVTVTSIRSVRIGAALFPARVPRMLVDGEELKLPNDVIVRRALDQAKRASRKTVGTAFFAKELLAGDFAVEQTRAATLTCVAGVDQGSAFPVAFAESVIGRADEADIRVRDRAASRRHATLTREGKAWFVTDLSATNGVFLNGVRVQGRQQVNSGDVIELGQTMLRFEAPERAPEEVTVVDPVEPPPPAPPPERPNPDLVVEASAITTALPAPRSRARVAVVIVVGVVLALAGFGVTVAMLR